MAVALLGAWAYTALPHAAERKPGVAVAEIRADEAARPGVAALVEARLNFVGRENCGQPPCASLLTFTQVPAVEVGAAGAGDAAGSGVSYTTAAQADPLEAGTAEQTSSPQSSSPQAEASAAGGQDAGSADASAAGESELAAERVEAEAVATGPVTVAPVTAAPVAADPIKPEPVGSEPVLAASEPAAASVQAHADVVVAAPSAPEAKTGDVSEIPATNASIEPVAASAAILDLEALEKRTIASRPPEAGAAVAATRPAKAEKAVAAVHKSQPSQGAKKNAVAARAKPASGVKIAVAKPTPKALPTDKQAVSQNPAANKAPGFQASAPTVSLFKPSPLKPALPPAVDTKAPEAPSMALNGSPGDKPPGFEIQTNLGGGFFAFQPY